MLNEQRLLIQGDLTALYVVMHNINTEVWDIVQQFGDITDDYRS